MLRIDLAVYNPFHELVLTVEVKKIPGVSDDWAKQLRRNIMAHGRYPQAAYFLLATPNRFFLWVGANNGLLATSPDYSVEASDLLAPFFNEFGTNPMDVSEFIFEQIVAKWLKSIMYPRPDKPQNIIPNWVIESGLDKSILRGDFFFEKAA